MIDKFKFRCTKVLPLVFDEALSYYEVLCKLTEKINDCIDKINEVNPDEVNAEIEELQEAVEDLDKDIEEIKEDIITINQNIEDLEEATKHYRIIDINADILQTITGSFSNIEDFNPNTDIIVGVRSKSPNGDETQPAVIITSAPTQYYTIRTTENAAEIHFTIYVGGESVGITVSASYAGGVWGASGVYAVN